MFRIVLCLALAVVASAVVEKSQKSLRAKGFVQALEFKHRLRVCNAYPFSSAVDILNGKLKLTPDMPMHYKTCKDFLQPLKAGDKLEFMIGDASAGAFAVSDLPSNDAILLLVIHRHDTLSTAVSFESHVFADMANAQVAIMDTYKGAAKSTVKIMDTHAKGKEGRLEELRYDSVVAVTPGNYAVELVGADGKSHVKKAFKAKAHESYVILRTGIEAQKGPAYDQELVIYPNSFSGAAQASVALMALVLCSVQWW